MIVGQRLSH